MAIFGKNRITRGFTAEKVRNAINLRLPEYNLDLHLEVSRGFTTEMDSVVNSRETQSRKTFTVMLGFKISIVNPRVIVLLAVVQWFSRKKRGYSRCNSGFTLVNLRETSSGYNGGYSGVY